MALFSSFQQTARKQVDKLDNVTPQERELLVDLFAINEGYEQITTGDRLAQMIAEFTSIGPAVDYMAELNEANLNNQAYNSTLLKLNEYIDKHGSGVIHELGFRLASWNTGFSKPVANALQEARTRFMTSGVEKMSEQLSKLTNGQGDIIKTLNNLDQHAKLLEKDAGSHFEKLADLIRENINTQNRQTAKTHELLKNYNMKVEQINALTQDKLNTIIHNFEQQQARADYIEGFSNAGKLFREINALGHKSGNHNLAAIGAVGEKGTNIALEVANLTGLIPGVAAPTGLAMLFPLANIAFAAASIFFMLRNKKSEGGNHQSAAQRVLIIISQQIGQLKAEMHDRFNQVDHKLEIIFNKIVDSFKHLETVLRADILNLHVAMEISFEKIRSDFTYFEEIVEHSQIKIRLDDFTKILNRLEGYTGNSDIANIKNAADKLLVKTAELETDWLMNNLCDLMFNAGIHHATNQPLSYTQLSRMSRHILRDVGAALGYLARFAKENLGLDIKSVDLPHIDLWLHGVKSTLTARSCLKTRHNKQVDQKNLQSIKTTANHTLNLIEVLSNSLTTTPQGLFPKLFEIYRKALKDLEKQILETIKERLKAKLVNQKSLSNIQLPTVTAETKHDLEPLSAAPLLARLGNHEVSAVLVEAHKSQLGTWEATYTGSKTTPNRGLINEVAHWKYDTYTKPSMPLYHLKLYFKLVTGEKITVFDNILFQTDLSNPNGHIEGEPSYYHELQAIKDWEAQQNAITVKSLTYENWPNSTKMGTPTVSLQHAATAENCIPNLTKKAWEISKQNNAVVGFIRDETQFIAQTPASAMETMGQLQSIHDLSLAYAQLLGFPQVVLDEIEKVLIIDLRTLLNDPAYFTNLEGAIDRLITTLDAQKTQLKSVVKMKVESAKRLIELFEQEILAHSYFFDPDNHHQPNINANYHNALQFSGWRKLDEGGFAIVYKCMWDTKVKEVAIKEIKDTDATPETETNFKNEVEILTKLQSDFIIQTYGYTKRHGKFGLVMELAKGSLYNALHKNKMVLNNMEQVEHAYQIAKGLSYLHSRNIIHNDVKSPNVLICNDKRVKLTDFGLAATEKQANKIRMSQSSTGANGALNQSSLLWRAPEAIGLKGSSNPTTAADVYSYGVVLWEILTNKLPFLSDYPRATEFDIYVSLKENNREAEQPTPVNADPTLKKIIQDCWQKEPSRRPTMHEIVQRLEQSFPHLCSKNTDEHDEKIGDNIAFKKNKRKPTQRKQPSMSSSRHSFVANNLGGAAQRHEHKETETERSKEKTAPEIAKKNEGIPMQHHKR